MMTFASSHDSFKEAPKIHFLFSGFHTKCTAKSLTILEVQPTQATREPFN